MSDIEKDLLRGMLGLYARYCAWCLAVPAALGGLVWLLYWWPD